MTDPTRSFPGVGVGTTQQVRAAGRAFHVWTAGDAGPAVVLIHGIPTNHAVWRDVVPHLAGRARVFAVDLLGYGHSDRPAGMPVDIAAQASYVDQLMGALGLERATVVGHDIGGGVAQILAVRHAGRVERLGIVDGVCYDGWPVPAVKALRAASPAIERLPARATVEFLQLLLRGGFVHQARAGAFTRAFVEPFATTQDPTTLVQHLRSLDPRHTMEVVPALRGLRVPVAVVWGRRDHQMKPKYGQRLANDIPTAELTWVSDASHFVPADTPDAVAAALHRLLDRPAGPAAS